MKKIIEHFGIDNQKRKFAEENLELQEAILEYQIACRNAEGMAPDYVEEYLKTYRMHVIEELADNFVILGEFMEWFKIKDYEIEGAARYKIGRTHHEIEKENKKDELYR